MASRASTDQLQPARHGMYRQLSQQPSSASALLKLNRAEAMLRHTELKGGVAAQRYHSPVTNRCDLILFHRIRAALCC